MTARITIRGTDDEVLDVLENLSQVPDSEAALDLFEGAAVLSNGTYVLDLEVHSAGQPSVARGHRCDPSRVQRLEQEVDRQQHRISELMVEVHRHEQDYAAVNQRREELEERLEAIRRYASGQVPTASSPNQPTGDPDVDRLTAYTANQLAASQG